MDRKPLCELWRGADSRPLRREGREGKAGAHFGSSVARGVQCLPTLSSQSRVQLQNGHRKSPDPAPPPGSWRRAPQPLPVASGPPQPVFRHRTSQAADFSPFLEDFSAWLMFFWEPRIHGQPP